MNVAELARLSQELVVTTLVRALVGEFEFYSESIYMGFVRAAVVLVEKIYIQSHMFRPKWKLYTRSLLVLVPG
jgi:hypothetical protein